MTTGTPQAADALSGAERDARVEALLLQGLDAYFGGEYEMAIHVWTRVLFLDRGHARARAYVERARSAQAERQRESEELLHRGVAAFDRGETGDARELLTAAVSQGASPDVALSYLGRLDRLEPVRPAADVAREARTLVRPSPPPPGTGRTTWSGRTLLGVALTAAGVGVAVWAAVVLFELTDLRAAFRLPPAAVARAPAVQDPLPVPRAADLALGRARAQFAAGHLADALRTLAIIGPSDPLTPYADRLRADIQRALLASASVPDAAAPAPVVRVP